MANADHIAVAKQGAKAIGEWREAHPSESLDLAEADLKGADLQGAFLSGANLRGAYLQSADLQDATLAEANLEGADLYLANLHGVFLREANLRGVFLYIANLRSADLQGTDLQGANFLEANLSKASLHSVQNAHQAYFLETVQFRPPDVRYSKPGQQPPCDTLNDFLGGDTNDVLYFDKCQRHWPERWLDWERLRLVGRLPLFGVSYSILIFIPFLFYGLTLYNDQVVLVRAWAEQIMTQHDHILYRLASLTLAHLHPRPIPQQSLLLLVSTILLAMGSTLYTFFCPSRVKEFSRDQWCDQLGRSLVHYWPLAWKYRLIRLVCTACYALGSAGALWVLGTKVWRVLLFILKYSPSP